MPTAQHDTEITLGTGRMLVIFFAFVLVCAIFFAIGFSLGRKTTMLGVNGGVNTSANSTAATVRPSSSKETSPKPESQPADFSFYKSVGSNSANAELTPPEAASQAPAATASEPPAPPAPASAAPVVGGYFVQVAAVNRQEDADALVEALKKKQYPAFAATNPSADKFYHVQVGPYQEWKDAEAMRTRLIADGYNPIVKK